MMSGSYFGDYEVLCHELRYHTTRAKVDVKILTLSKEVYRDIIDRDYPEVARRMIREARKKHLRAKRCMRVSIQSAKLQISRISKQAIQEIMVKENLHNTEMVDSLRSERPLMLNDKSDRESVLPEAPPTPSEDTKNAEVEDIFASKNEEQVTGVKITIHDENDTLIRTEIIENINISLPPNSKISQTKIVFENIIQNNEKLTELKLETVCEEFAPFALRSNLEAELKSLRGQLAQIEKQTEKTLRQFHLVEKEHLDIQSELHAMSGASHRSFKSSAPSARLHQPTPWTGSKEVLSHDDSMAKMINEYDEESNPYRWVQFCTRVPPESLLFHDGTVEKLSLEDVDESQIMYFLDK